MSKEIRCLFGFHEYTIPWKENKDVLICENCKRVGYIKDITGLETWCNYDKEGNIIHYRNSNEFEEWYIGKSTLRGNARFNINNWVDKKPENWIYENV
ncbi:MAG: hypothetical protein U9Q97_10095 [Acidobacteriota bacterium]|nr:hypothetical protein [Acidobacteriota bacterium]